MVPVCEAAMAGAIIASPGKAGTIAHDAAMGAGGAHPGKQPVKRATTTTPSPLPRSIYMTLQMPANSPWR